jgi:hypothetical protein
MHAHCPAASVTQAQHLILHGKELLLLEDRPVEKRLILLVRSAADGGAPRTGEDGGRTDRVSAAHAAGPRAPPQFLNALQLSPGSIVPRGRLPRRTVSPTQTQRARTPDGAVLHSEQSSVPERAGALRGLWRTDESRRRTRLLVPSPVFALPLPLAVLGLQKP